MVGLVSNTYFQTHFDPALTGATPPPPPGPSGASKTVLAAAGSPEVVAHELGHTFGQLSELYKLAQDKTAVYNNTPVQGYDATANVTYVWPPNLQAFMTAAVSFMGPSGLNGGLRSSSPYNYWVDSDTYSKILGSLTSLPPNDPQTILVSGVLTSDGQFTLGSSLVLPNGVVTSSDSSGDVTVALLDANNGVLSQTSLVSNFQLLATYASESPAGPSLIDTGAMSVVVELPYAATASVVQISKGGVVLQRKSLSGQLLQGILSAIPDNAFVKPEFCRKLERKDKVRQKICENYVSIDRAELGKIVADIQKRLSLKNPQRAVEQLEHLIVEVREMTFRNYKVQDTSELMQAEVISQIRKILESLKKERRCDHGGRH